MARVQTGLDRWLREGPTRIGATPGQRVGLLAHPASICADGRHLLELLEPLGTFGAGRLPLNFTRLFAPEHGLWGQAQDMETVESGRDPWTGLPIVSLYGEDESSLTPTPADLADLDLLVVDLQDIGTRYYTYIYTLSGLMAVAGQVGLPVVVLDRPNPIAEQPVDGPLLQPAFASFVGRVALPITHGLTIGELAIQFRDRFAAACDLTVVPLEGWQRGMPLEDCGLPWVPPSPNMPSLTTARLYPGGCLIEGTNLSEGRGTTTPFELVGAPWLQARQLAETMRELELPGVAFRPASFLPMFQKHAGVPCEGVQVILTDPKRVRPLWTYLMLIAACREQSPSRFDWRRERYEFVDDRLAIDLLCGGEEPRRILEKGNLEGNQERLLAWTAGPEDQRTTFELLRNTRYGELF